MLVPLSWLRDFAPIEGDVSDLASAFSNLGLVVDGVQRVGEGLDGIVVARVLATRPHPSADRVHLVDVSVSPDSEPLQIVCGAFNMSAGDLVPLATLGTTMPNGMTIERRKMRGEWSNGMLCSAAELELPDPSEGKGILVLPPDLAEPGTPLKEALGIETDVVFDLDVSPNRPDALSIMGVARDLAAALKIPFTVPGLSGRAFSAEGPVPTVSILDPDLCPRFTATVLTGVEVGPSPAWLARRLTLAGMRPINNVVDVSNYVMLEVGQPNHPYDLSRLGGGGLQVRRARPGETVVTLDGVSRSMEADDCLICDATGTPVGIGGIMGGASSEVSTSTTTVLLEAAYFTPMAIAHTGKRLGLFTEARSRFERGTDPFIIDLAIDRFAALLPGVLRGQTVDVGFADYVPAPRPVRVRVPRINDILGTSLEASEVASLLAPIGFTSSVVSPDSLEVVIPTWRPDSEREIDVIEEVARLYGYRKIPRTLPPGVRTGGGLTAYQRDRRRVRDILVGAGVTEGWTTTFLGPGDLARAGLPEEAVEVENPLDRSESLLRTSLLPGLLKAVRFNVDRQEPDVRLFEIGRVFELPPPGQVLPVEREELGVVVAGSEADAVLSTRLWAVLGDGLRLDGVVLSPSSGVPGMHPTRTAVLSVPSLGLTVGAVGEVDPSVVSAYGLSGRVGLFSVSLEALLGSVPRRPMEAAPISRFPASDIDLAFVVSTSVLAGDVASTLRSAGGPLVERVQLFDVYPLSDDRRSLAFHVRLRALDHTLTDAEISQVRERLIDAVASAHGGELRG
jgi:phenylalanyl-tRNA synthetase beta chain